MGYVFERAKPPKQSQFTSCLFVLGVCEESFVVREKKGRDWLCVGGEEGRSFLGFGVAEKGNYPKTNPMGLLVCFGGTERRKRKEAGWSSSCWFWGARRGEREKEKERKRERREKEKETLASPL
jgi:hypothetical protein